MHVAYDLSVNPPTYDVISFLSYVELLRQHHAAPTVSIHILPGPKDGFRLDSLWPRTVEGRVQLRDNVLEPICWLLPSVVEVSIHSKPQSVGIGQGARWISLPFYLRQVLSKGSRPLRYQGEVKRSRKLVTITLREAEHHPKRNSNVKEWLIAAQHIEQMGYDVVFVRDTAKAGEHLPFLTHDEAAKGIFSRAKLYSSALVNLGINNGPMWLAIAMNLPVLMLRPTTEIGGCYDKRFFSSCGLPEGSQLPKSPAHQRLAWQDDTADNILTAFKGMLPCLRG